jgi:hypothetical protein
MELMTKERPELIGTELGGKRMVDAYGCEYVYAYAVQAVVLNTAYTMTFGAYGLSATTPAASGMYKLVIVADKALATGEYGWFAVRGPHDMVIKAAAKGTAGDAILLHTDGVVTCTDAAYSQGDDDECAVLLENKASGTSKTCLVYLTGQQIYWA